MAHRSSHSLGWALPRAVGTRKPYGRTVCSGRIGRSRGCEELGIIFWWRMLGTYGGHHFSHVAQLRSSSVKSGTISFSATTYSYRESRTSLILAGTVKYYYEHCILYRGAFWCGDLQLRTVVACMTSNSFLIQGSNKRWK